MTYDTLNLREYLPILYGHLDSAILGVPKETCFASQGGVLISPALLEQVRKQALPGEMIRHVHVIRIPTPAGAQIVVRQLEDTVKREVPQQLREKAMDIVRAEVFPRGIAGTVQEAAAALGVRL